MHTHAYMHIIVMYSIYMYMYMYKCTLYTCTLYILGHWAQSPDERGASHEWVTSERPSSDQESPPLKCLSPWLLTSRARHHQFTRASCEGFELCTRHVGTQVWPLTSCCPASLAAGDVRCEFSSVYMHLHTHVQLLCLHSTFLGPYTSAQAISVSFHDTKHSYNV